MFILGKPTDESIFHTTIRVISIHGSKATARVQFKNLSVSAGVHVYPVEFAMYGKRRAPRIGDQLSYFDRGGSVLAPKEITTADIPAS